MRRSSALLGISYRDEVQQWLHSLACCFDTQVWRSWLSDPGAQGRSGSLSLWSLTYRCLSQPVNCVNELMLIIILFCLQAHSGCLYHSLSYVVACQNEAKACIVTAIRFFNTLYQRSCFCYNFLMDKILFSNAFFLMCCTYWYQISQLRVDFIKWTIFKLFVIVYMFIINIVHVLKKTVTA